MHVKSISRYSRLADSKGYLLAALDLQDIYAFFYNIRVHSRSRAAAAAAGADAVAAELQQGSFVTRALAACLLLGLLIYLPVSINTAYRFII